MASRPIGMSNAALSDSEAKASAPARIRYSSPVWSSLRNAKWASLAASWPTPSAPTIRSIRFQLRSSRKLDRSHTKAASAQPMATTARTGLEMVIWSGTTLPLPGPLTDPQLQRRRTEPEVLPDLALEVAEV